MEMTQKKIGNGDAVNNLVKDCLADGGQCLVFVNTRRSTETEAKRLGPIVGEYWQIVSGKFEDPNRKGKKRSMNYAVAVPLHGKIDTPLKIFESPTEIRLTVEVHFDVDKTDIREADKPNLEEVAKVIDRYFSDGEIVLVEGHTDESGAVDYNLKLSQQRAVAVTSYLVSTFGLSAGQLKSVGYGESRPVVPGATGDAGQVNRRVVFSIPKI